MKQNTLYQDAPFSTFEVAALLGMGDHKAQVVAWARRHIAPFEVDKTNFKKQMMRLDLVNVFEMFLIKTLKNHHLKPGLISNVISRKQIEGLLFSSEREYLMIFGGIPIPMISNNPMFLLQHSKGAASVLLIDFQEIKRQIFEGITRVRK